MLAAPHYLRSLRSLTGGAVLAAPPYLRSLRSLTGGAVLAALPYLRSLRSLTGGAVLAALPYLRSLRSLTGGAPRRGTQGAGRAMRRRGTRYRSVFSRASSSVCSCRCSA